MAGKVEVYNKFNLGFNGYDAKSNFKNGHFLEKREISEDAMEENELYKFLTDAGLKRRTDVLEKLLLDVRRSGGTLPYNDAVSIFQGLAIALLDANGDVRLKCIQLISETISNLGDDLDPCMYEVLKNLIPNLGDAKITIRRSVVQSLHLYMKYTGDFANLLRAFSRHGLDHPESRVRREMIITLPVLLTGEFSGEDLFPIVQPLTKKLLDNPNEENMRDGALLTLDKIQNLVGESSFSSYLQKLSSPLRRYYLNLVGKPMENGQVGKQPNGPLIKDSKRSPRLDHNSNSDTVEFGIVPSHIMQQIYDQDNFRSRSQAVEELKNIITDLFRLDLLLPHMVSFISFLNTLLDDSNFKITMVSLEILQVLVDKLGENVASFERPLSLTLLKRMGDNKIVVRQAVMKVAIQMMQGYSPKSVLSVMCESLDHKNSRIRQEIVNIVIAALLKFPSYSFDLSVICQSVGPLLLDPKRHVRQAALECFSVLAQAMGPGRLLPLVQAVDMVELRNEGEGVMAAVQARLSRRLLPKLNADDLVEYAIPLPNSGQRIAAGVQKGADIDWILSAASGGTSSARSRRSEYMEIESLSSRSSPIVTPDTPSKRFMSAGKGRGKLPWDEDERNKMYENTPSSAPQTNSPAHSPSLKHTSSSIANGGTSIPREASLATKDHDSSIPTMSKGSSTQKNKIPPIQPSMDRSIRDMDRESSVSSWHDEIECSEMNNSLRQIRNSASKKKAARLFENLEKRHTMVSRSPSPPYSAESWPESGFYTASTIGDNASDISSISSKSSKKKSNPFESRPKLARSNSIKKPPTGDPIIDAAKSPTDYNPLTGVTFRENRTSDVQIVGKGYGDETKELKPANTKQSKERRRVSVTKGSHLSPLGIASTFSFGSIDLDDDRLPTQDNIGVVGIGMFDTNSSATESPIDRSPSKTSNPDRTKAAPSGICVVGVRQNSMEKIDVGVVEDEDVSTLSMSKTTHDKMVQRKQQRQDEVDQKKRDKEERLQVERERQQEKLKNLATMEDSSSSETLSNNSCNTSPRSSPTKPSGTLTPRKKSKSIGSLSATSSNGEKPPPFNPSLSQRSIVTSSENPEDWKPFKDPDGALREALKHVATDDWEMKCNGINTFRRLCKYHNDVVTGQLHAITIALIAEVKNLRSQVSRLAIVAFGEMYTNIKKKMETDLNITARVLLCKAGESNGFIRDDVDTTIQAMVDSISPQRALIALIDGGATHRSSAVRRTAAQFLTEIIERMGAGWSLSGVKDITDRILTTAAQFTGDGSQETRYYGRKILNILLAHHDFEKMLSKHLNQTSTRNVKDIVENLKIKGLGDMPSETTSARSRRSGQGSRSSSFRGSSAASNLSQLSDVPKKKVLKTGEEDIKILNSLLSANDWRDRYKGITQFLEMSENDSDVIASNIAKIFDKYLPRLHDPNVKVNLYALKVMIQVIPVLSDRLSSVINLTIQKITPNLNSKNKEIYGITMETLDAIMDHVDPTILIQPFADQAMCASPRGKPDLVEKVAYLVTKVYPKKQKHVILHVLPLLWDLLGSSNTGSSNIQSGHTALRSATIALAKTLDHQMASSPQMGPSLIDHAQASPTVSERQLQLLQNLIDQ